MMNQSSTTFYKPPKTDIPAIDEYYRTYDT